MIKNGVVYKQDLLMISLTDFYKDVNNIDMVLPIIEGGSNVSLRILDWFVTNYAKKYNTSYIPTTLNKQFIVYLNYKSQLKAYSKKQFDPFCRRDRISFFYNTENYIETTVGQLNFFRWAIQNQIIDYIKSHIQEIEDDMNSTVRSIYIKQSANINKIIEKSRRKRQELSISATKTVNKHNVNIVVQFE